MKIVAALAWYDEPVAFLDRCVKSLGGIADTLVAFDGAWNGYPGGHCSPTEQSLAITDAANDVDLEVVKWMPCYPWGSQTEKRNALMRYASDLGGPESWLFVIDGDEYVQHADPQRLRQALATTDRDVASVTAKRISGERANVAASIRRLFRAPVTVERAHNGYRSARGQWLNGDSAYVKLAKSADATQMLTLHHDYMNRSDERNKARLAYRCARRRDRIETWV